MMNLLARLTLCLWLLLFSATHTLAEGASTPDAEIAESEEEGRSFLVGALLYLPNRVLDLVDIFRLRVRVGPGFSVGVRATEIASAYLGSYASIYAGLPGPRQRTLPRLPVGLESHNGVSVSVADATVDGGLGPDYSPTEFGGGFQLAVAGVDFGIDPVEALDFIAGFMTIDLRDDDL